MIHCDSVFETAKSMQRASPADLRCMDGVFTAQCPCKGLLLVKDDAEADGGFLIPLLLRNALQNGYQVCFFGEVLPYLFSPMYLIVDRRAGRLLSLLPARESLSTSIAQAGAASFSLCSESCSSIKILQSQAGHKSGKAARGRPCRNNSANS